LSSESANTNTYQAGSCNIGKGEIRRRQFVAAIGLFLTVFSTAGLISNHASKGARFSIFMPALVFSIGWIQARRKFCLAFGFMGTFNFGKLGQLSKVASKEDKAADRATAISIMTQSIILAGAITGLIYFLPL
jgi:hypothetical protein